MAFVALGAAVIAAVLIYGVMHTSKWRAALTTLSERFGLDYSGGGLFNGHQVVGSVDGHHVSVDSFKRSRSTYTRIVVDTDLPRDVRIGREGFGSALAKAFGSLDIEVGVADFDRIVVIRGDDIAQVVSYFGHETRRAVDALIATGAEIEGGELKLERSGLMTDPVALQRQVEIMLAAASLLSTGGQTTPRRLERHTLDDPEPLFRARCLELLLTNYPSSPEARQVASHALHDADPHVRLLAAESLVSEEARRVVIGVLTGHDHPLPLRAEAARVLASAFGQRADSVAALTGLLDDAPDGLVDDLLLSLLKLNAIPPVEELARFTTEPYGAMAREASARCLGVPPHPADGGAMAEPQVRLQRTLAEAHLLALLEDPSDDVRAAAARSLGAVGGRRVVEALTSHTTGLFRSAEVKEAAREAIQEIQSRLRGAAAGQLSLSDAQGSGGELAVTKPSGQLTEADS